MRSCLVIGSGRGGTSLLAGTVARAGYYAGERLHGPRLANPKGYYEDIEINAINERLLQPVAPELVEGQRWLVSLPLGLSIPRPDTELEARIRRQVERSPFCLKDPRFCYTLDAWRPHLGDAAFLCVFRPPLATARSIAVEVAEEDYLAPLRAEMTEERALSVWTAMYRWVLERQSTDGDWLFLHYDQIVDGSGIDRLERLLGTPVDRGFADRTLNRTFAGGAIPAETREIYGELSRLAGYRTPQSVGRRLMSPLRRGGRALRGALTR